ncbi:hypothetical protein MMC27_008871 [Xylographa pallens]|nr:hypothetical protein [Xylographa pallens]
MASPPQHTYLITGATRGIGHALLAHYLALPSNLLIAGVRDPSSTAARSLASLPHGAGSSLVVVKIDSLADQDAAQAMHTLRTAHGVARLDTVVANAGIMTNYDRMADVAPAALRQLVDVHAVAPLLLFQAAQPLLAAAPRPAFVLLGSPVGSIAGVEARPFPMGAYGASKAMAHYIVRKIHAENEGLVAFVVDPG